MAKRNTKTAQTVEHNKPIPRSYDPMAMEARIYNLEKNSGSSPTPSSEEYSTTETEIGTYLTDKLYRKVVQTEVTGTVTGDNAITLVSGLTNIKSIIKAWCVVATSATSSPIGVINDSIWLDNSGNLKTKVTTGYLNVTDLKVIIEYTKTS